MKTITLKFLQKLATVAVALLLYGVIVVLQGPKHARAADSVVVPQTDTAAVCAIARA